MSHAHVLGWMTMYLQPSVYDFDAGFVYHSSSVTDNTAAKLDTFVDFEG
jgi:hypothetical protein